MIFGIALFGTLIETGTGMIHAVNERLANSFEEKGRELPRATRSATALGLLAVAALMGRVGLIDLIARGYGAMAWVFLAIFVIPVLTWGVWKVRREPRATNDPRGAASQEAGG